MTDVWTIKRLLDWISGYLTEKAVDSPRLCAELLLSHVLGLKRIELYMHFDRGVERGDLERLRSLVRRAGEHEPAQHLTGKTEFYGIEFDVSCDCLIPRPETELLVERAIEFLRGRSGPQSVCDLCTGCGCVAVAIAKNFENARILATDISEPALEVAARNVAKYGLEDRIQLLASDLFEPVLPRLDTEKFDLIVSNPPYVSAGEYEKLDRNVREYEPATALLAGEDGLDIIRRLVAESAAHLKSGAALLVEIGYSQGPAALQLAGNCGFFEGIRVEKDHAKLDRIIIATRK